MPTEDHSPKVRKAIITDAGFASRYLPVTKTLPKAMLPLGNKPIMQFMVEECLEAGITEIIIVATPEGKPIYEDYFHNSLIRIKKQLTAQGKAERYAEVQAILDYPSKIIVITQDESLPYGNGAPVASAQKYVEGEEAFLVLYSDDMVFGSPGDAKALVTAYSANPDASAIIMAQMVAKEVVDKYGIISFKKNSESELDHIVEKPDLGTEPSQLASYGRYLLKPSIFTFLTPNGTGKDNELWTVDAITQVAKNKKVLVEQTKGEWLTTGDPENYFRAHLKYVLEKEKYGSKVLGWLNEFKSV
ncbi:MAG TPA: sugar phosphate nucleotidyltransferase [Patescibacteria group bacterium]|jgi:UTP--glucose-1-phosphate uridylyltransferase